MLGMSKQAGYIHLWYRQKCAQLSLDFTSQCLAERGQQQDY